MELIATRADSLDNIYLNPVKIFMRINLMSLIDPWSDSLGNITLNPDF